MTQWRQARPGPGQLFLPGHCAVEHVCDATAQHLIHSERRGPHESSSELGQYVHDNFPREFNFVDIDAAVHKRRTAVLRILEHKLPGQDLSPAQWDVLPLLAIALELLGSTGGVARTSGVFRTAGYSPFKELEVTRIRPDGSLSKPVVLTGPQLRDFLSGEVLQ